MAIETVKTQDTSKNLWLLLTWTSFTIKEITYAFSNHFPYTRVRNDTEIFLSFILQQSRYFTSTQFSFY
jgi:hypothetical protein